MPSPLLTDRVRECASSDDLSKPGDFCIRDVPVYNSDKIIHSMVLKCPYCGMSMMSVAIHKISYSRVRRMLSFLGVPVGVTVTPKLTCPYINAHTFSITNGRIKPAQ